MQRVASSVGRPSLPARFRRFRLRAGGAALSQHSKTDKAVTFSTPRRAPSYISAMPDTDPHTPPRRSYTQASEQGSETGTDGYVPQPLDKALLGGAPQRVGTFEYRYDT